MMYIETLPRLSNGVQMVSGGCAQRALLEALTALAASVLGSQVPVAVVTLETIGLLLEALGEVAPETTALLQEPLAQKLTGAHSFLRAQARGPPFSALKADVCGARLRVFVRALGSSKCIDESKKDCG